LRFKLSIWTSLFVWFVFTNSLCVWFMDMWPKSLWLFCFLSSFIATRASSASTC
jgi:hypothetical protein